MMQPLRRLIVEAHRRSVWQVLSVYLVGCGVSLQVVGAVTDSAGLPDWTPGFAFVLMLVGLPVVLATAIVQEGAPGAARREEEAQPAPANLAPPSFLDRNLTWRRSLLGGVAALALLGIALGGYFAMRALGIGPVASLTAQGLIEDGDKMVLADFSNATEEAQLGSVVTEALRIDLATSDVLALAEPEHIAVVLRRMQRDPSAELTPELAREVAVRDGMKAVLEGEIGAARARATSFPQRCARPQTDAPSPPSDARPVARIKSSTRSTSSRRTCVRRRVSRCARSKAGLRSGTFRPHRSKPSGSTQRVAA